MIMDTDAKTSSQDKGWEPARPRIPRCFMSEKWCMGEKDICAHWKRREDELTLPKAFVIMDYNPRTDLIYETQIRPMLANMDTPFIPTRADTVMRTGYIVCQKICRPILISDLVVVDITNTNSNVLYELGLSVALERPVLLMAQKVNGKPFPGVTDLLKRLNLLSDSCYYYQPFEYIPNSRAELQKHIWQLPKQKEGAPGPRGKVGILGSDHVVPAPGSGRGGTRVTAETFQVTDALRAQMGTSLREAICGIKRFHKEQEHEDHLRARPHPAKSETEREKARRNFLEGFAKYLEGKEFPGDVEGDIPYYAWMYVRSMRTDTCSFREIKEFIDSCEYLMVDLTQSEDLRNSMNFFWIGYCHGKGKQVIPIEVYDSGYESYDHNRRAFDIQGLYYFGYDIRQPQKVCDQFSDLFYNSLMEKDLKEEARNVFWKPFFSDPALRIFVGASAYSENYSLNEWDYLALAELNRYFSDAKPTLQCEIISPIYSQPLSVLQEMVKDNEIDEFLRSHLEGHNCIIIGSPDVNVLTELVMAKALNIEPFRPDLRTEEWFSGCVTTKEGYDHRSLIFYSNGKPYPPFHTSFPHKSPRPTCSTYTFCNITPETQTKSDQPDVSPEMSFHHSYGHFAYLDNPFTENKKIIILSGISGPATLALAQMLTGYKNNPDPLLLEFPNLKRRPSVVKQEENWKIHLSLPEYKLVEEEREMFKKDVEMMMRTYGDLAERDAVVMSADGVTVTFDNLIIQKEEFESEEFHRTDQSDMSIEILTRINKAIRLSDRGQVVGAIVQALISRKTTGEKPAWSDGRRVVSWRFPDPPTGEKEFSNPFTITPLKESKHPCPA